MNKKNAEILRNWLEQTLSIPAVTTVLFQGRELAIERWYTTVGEAWQASSDLNCRAFVLKTNGSPKKFQVTRTFQMTPSTLETLPAQASVLYATMDQHGVSGTPDMKMLTQIEAIGLLEQTLRFAVSPMLLDNYLGQCVMLQIRHGAPHNVPPMTFHGTLRRLQQTISYELDAPDHDYPDVQRGTPTMQFEFIAIANATLCPITHGTQDVTASEILL